MMKRLFAFRLKHQSIFWVLFLTLLFVPEVAFAFDPVGWIGRTTAGILEGTVLALPTAMVYLMFTVVNTILWIAGTLFNVAVVLTVFQFASFFGNTEGIHAAWTVLRDVGNIVLLFGFIFMGLGTVLNLQEYTIKKALPGFIIFAVLLNFSLFASQAVIDVANVLASSFYAQAMDNGGGCTNPNADDFLPCINDGIAGKVMQVTGVASVYSPNIIGGYGRDPMGTMTMLIMLTIFSAIAATVLFAGAIMFIIRAAVLVFLMVLSPIGFAGMAVPPLQKLARDWWKKLIEHAFFAPVYILLVLVALKVAEGLVDTTGGAGGGLAGAVNLEGGGMASGQMFLTFALITGFMAFALVGAQKFGAMGASFATKTAGGVALGGIGFVGRRTGGRLSLAAANRIRGSKFGETGMGKVAAGFADRGAKASYSLRGAAPFKALGVDVGKPNKTAGKGYYGIKEQVIKDEAEYAKSIKGARMETRKEAEARIAKARKNKEAVDTEVKAALPEKQRAVEAAQAKQINQKSIRDNAAFAVAEQKAILARNPADATAHQELRKAEEQLAREERDLASSTEALTKANQELTDLKKRQAEAQAASEDSNPKELSEKERRIKYAENRVDEGYVPIAGIERLPFINKGHGFTLAESVRREAKKKITEEENKSKLQRALDTIKSEVEHNKDDKEHGESKPSAGPKPSSGGGKPAHAPDH